MSNVKNRLQQMNESGELAGLHEAAKQQLAKNKRDAAKTDGGTGRSDAAEPQGNPTEKAAPKRHGDSR